MPAPLERKAGFERAQLLVRSARARRCSRFLRALARRRSPSAGDRRVRWSLDVDPQEV